MGYCEPALILGHSPSPSLMPLLPMISSLTSSLVHFSSLSNFSSPIKLAALLFMNSFRARKRSPFKLTQVQEAKLLEGKWAGEGAEDRKCSQHPCQFRSRDREDPPTRRKKPFLIFLWGPRVSCLTFSLFICSISLLLLFLSSVFLGFLFR